MPASSSDQPSENTILIRFWKGIGIVRRNLFWLSDEQWKRIEPHLPTDVRGIERADDRRVISGIVQVLKSGCRWCDCPPEYGPPTTIYNRFVRSARRGVCENLFRELAGNGRSKNTQMIDLRTSKPTARPPVVKGGSRAGYGGSRGGTLLENRLNASRRALYRAHRICVRLNSYGSRGRLVSCFVEIVGAPGGHNLLLIF